MARRKTKKSGNIAIVPAMVALAMVWASGQMLIHNGGLILVVVLVFAVVLIVARYTYRQFSSWRLAQALAEKREAVISKHLDALVRRRAQLVSFDAYGKEQTGRWDKELSQFIKNHIFDGLTDREIEEINHQYGDVARFIDGRVTISAASAPAFQYFSDDMTHREFEIFCSEELKRDGWNAYPTKGAGDQGADVIADRDGRRLVVQCKLYGNPVGNKAVQEIAAARAHENADYAIVVTNNSYTRSAEQLATTNNVLLLHFTSLRTLWSELRQRTPSPTT